VWDSAARGALYGLKECIVVHKAYRSIEELCLC